MPRDSSGTYTPPSNSFYPAQADTNIDPNDWNESIKDVSAAISETALPDLSNVNWAELPAATMQEIYDAMEAAGCIVDSTATNLSGVNWAQVTGLAGLVAALQAGGYLAGLSGVEGG